MVELEYSALGVTQVKYFTTLEEAMNEAAEMIREDRGRPRGIYSPTRILRASAIYAWVEAQEGSNPAQDSD